MTQGNDRNQQVSNENICADRCTAPSGAPSSAPTASSCSPQARTRPLGSDHGVC